ncbi:MULTISPECIES: hypothetical protein [Micrococcales]|nr:MULTISPECIES: hypothetical protein [Micrococcales]
MSIIDSINSALSNLNSYLGDAVSYLGPIVKPILQALGLEV